MRIKEDKNGVTYFIIPKEEIQKIDFALCKEPKQTLEKFYADQTEKPNFLINGGFFALSTGETVFDYINESVRKSSDNKYTIGIGVRKNGNLEIGQDTEEWKDFLTAYPLLLCNGVKVSTPIGSEIDGKHRRSIIGYNDKEIIFITIDDPGATLKDAANLALNIGCTYAVNLDGGGSTRALCEGKAYAKALYNRPVDNLIAVYLRPKVIYRVQLGAFLRKAGANSYCETIKKLGKDYESAYVKYIFPYYKVQVGAFSKKENANRMVANLKAKGYNAFVTTN